MYLQSIKSVNHNAAMSVNRSILRKSQHLGIGLLQFNPSTGAALVPDSETSFAKAGKFHPVAFLIGLKMEAR
jgi:hypothetical protein